jgi:hypothetical protein
LFDVNELEIIPSKVDNPFTRSDPDAKTDPVN